MAREYSDQTRRVWDSIPTASPITASGDWSLGPRGPTQGVRMLSLCIDRRRPRWGASDQRGGCGIRTHETLLPTGFQDQLHRPLGQPSQHMPKHELQS